MKLRKKVMLFIPLAFLIALLAFLVKGSIDGIEVSGMVIIFNLGVMLNLFLLLLYVIWVTKQISESPKPSIDLKDVRENPEKYMGERTVELKVVSCTLGSILDEYGNRQRVSRVTIEDELGNKIEFYAPQEDYLDYARLVGKKATFKLVGDEMVYSYRISYILNRIAYKLKSDGKNAWSVHAKLVVR